MKKPQPKPQARLAKPKRTASILSTGSYVPEKILSNADLEKMVETSDDWIVTRTGIRERRIAAEGECTSQMATKAALKAMEQGGVKAGEIDLIIVATVTPDMAFPSTACFVQKQLGAKNAACFDISAACAGFLYAIDMAQQFITNHVYETVLVIGAEKLSGIVNWKDRNTCVLFGDGAGAAILRHREGALGILSTRLGADGTYTDILSIPGGGCRLPITAENVGQNLNTIHMAGKEVYKQAVIAMQNAAVEALEEAGLTADDIACFVPHQANMRIIEAIAQRMDVPMERFMINLDRYGNTSAAAVAIALDEANRTGRFKQGDFVLMVVFGGGLTWSSAVVEW